MFFNAVQDDYCSQRKRFWLHAHRWSPAPEPAYLSLSGSVEFVAVERLVRQIERAGDVPLHVTIESFGGNPHAGFDLFWALRGHPPPVTTATTAQCHSAAIIAYLSGDRRLAHPGATFLIHPCSQYSSGHAFASMMRDDANELEQLDREIQFLISVRTAYAGVTLRRDMRVETFWTLAKLGERAS
jgi:ATP-dependent protease ClpP protease subunit